MSLRRYWPFLLYWLSIGAIVGVLLCIWYALGGERVP